MIATVLGFFKVKSHLILLALLAVSMAFGYVQTTRLSSSTAAVSAKTQTVKVLTERVNSDRQQIATRDMLIAKQNAAVSKLVTAAQADRTAYLSRIAKADKVATAYERNATALLARTTTATDELQRSRAALALIRETLAAEGTTNVHP